MKFSAVLTKKQAEEMLVYLGDLFTEVRLLDIEAVKHLEKNSLSLRAFWEKCQKTRLEYIDSRVCQKISRYVETMDPAPCDGDLKCSGRYNRIL